MLVCEDCVWSLSLAGWQAEHPEAWGPAGFPLDGCHLLVCLICTELRCHSTISLQAHRVLPGFQEIWAS